MRLTIRTKLAVLVLAALLPLLAAAAWRFSSDLTEGRRLADQSQLDTARLVAGQLDEVLTGQTESLLALASFRALDRVQDTDLEMLATRVREQHPFVRRFVAAGADGRVVAASGLRLPESTFATPEILAAVMRRGEVVVTAPQPSSTDQRPVVPLMVPVQDRQGSVVGVFGAEIDLEVLSRYLTALPLSPGQTVAIVAQNGAVLARSTGPTKFVDRRVTGVPEAEALLGRGGGISEWRSPDGVVHLAGAASMSRAPWIVMAAVPSAVANSPATGRLRRDLAGLGAATVLGLLLAWLVGNRMHGSVRVLIRGARDLESAEGPPITVPTRDELAELAEQFNRSMEERREARAALAARQRRLRAMADVNAALSQQLDLEPLLRQITAALAQLTGARNVVFWEVDEAGRRLFRRTWTADPAIAIEGLPQVLEPGTGGTGWVASHRQPLFVEDVAHDERIISREWAVEQGVLSFAGVPVQSGEHLLGVLTLNLRREDMPDEEGRELLMSFAAQAAVAVRNARLYGEATRRQGEAEEIARIAQTLTGSLDVDDIAQRIVASVLPVLRARSCGLRLVQPDGSLMVIAQAQRAGVGASYGQVVPPGYGITGQAVTDGRAVVSADALSDPRMQLTAEMRERLQASGLSALLAVPLRVQGRIIGALSIEDRTGRRFTDVETALLQTFADQAALALDHARLYEQTRQRLRHVESIREVVAQILVPVTLEERLNLIARKAAELFDANLALVALRAGDGEELVIRAGHNLVAGELGQTLAIGEGALGFAAAKREGVLINDYGSWPGRMRRVLTPERKDLLGATIAYPLMSRGRAIGALSVAYLGHEQRRFVPEDLDRLATLAAPAALAIEHGRLYDELAARVRQLQETQAQLVQAGKLSAVGQLVSGVAHELNNPLSVVIGYGQLLRSKPLPPEVRGPLEMIVTQGERMAKIVQGLLLFSRQRKPERAPVDLPAVVEQTVALRAARLRLSGIRVEADHEPGVPPAEGDVHQLQQVILNLLLNAEHAIMSDGSGDTIRVRARECREDGRRRVLVEFEDNGPGIPPEVMPRIFEPFFTTKKVGEGTGLGLSVSYGIVQQHGGRLSAESAPGRTVFTIDLPAAETEPARQTPSPAQTGVYGLGRRALVVDDEPGMVDLVTALLKDTGWQVEVAATGRSALERVRGAHFDVVLSDIRMPDGSGEDFYRAAVREQPALAKRFIFMSGDTANPAAWQFVEEIQAPALEKPFTADMLFRALERVTILTSRAAFE